MSALDEMRARGSEGETSQRWIRGLRCVAALEKYMGKETAAARTKSCSNVTGKQADRRDYNGSDVTISGLLSEMHKAKG